MKGMKVVKINNFKTFFDKKALIYFDLFQINDLLKESLKYSFFSGGKRLRPWIIYNIGRYYNIEEEKLLKIGFITEILHTASLIHDDLPSIDNSNFRRGKETNHIKFSEWQAILAGDLGFVLPFYMFSQFDKVESKKLNSFFSKAILDLIEGEALDIAFEKKVLLPKKEDIEEMYVKKTSALFEFSFGVAPLLKEKDDEYEILKKVGRNFGISFQIYDDLKDKYGMFEDIGKDLNKDENKYTLLKIMSDKDAKKYADTLFNETLNALLELGMSEFAKALMEIKSLIERK
jgi:geranylgeranyl diphosphate synthase type II